MSYILDALRRADAERERGAVPSLHTQQYGALPGDGDDPARRGRLPTIVAALLAAALLAVLAWHYVGGPTAPPPTVQAALTPPPVAVAARPVEVVPSASAAAAAATPSAPPSPAATRRASRREPTTSSATPPATPSTGNATTPAPAAGDRVYAMADLPDDVRRDLPKLAFGGASFSSDPGSRMVILNGQVFHEGDGITRGVVLQRVNRKSAILVVRGYRFELMF